MEEVLSTWVMGREGSYLDGTVGIGGHAEALLSRFPEARLIGLDRDSEALELAEKRLAAFGDRVRLEQADFADMESALSRMGGSPVIGILLDLGVSSLQLDDPRRGFSYQEDGPLGMTLDPEAEMDAAGFLAGIEESNLVRILKEHGELPGAGRAARSILDARDRDALNTTGQLVTALRRAGVSSPRRLSQAFQGIRLGLNDELGSLSRGIDSASRILPPGGTLTVISFESLMDRVVKQAFRPPRHERPMPGVPDPDPAWNLLHRKVVRPSAEEVTRNPRARSARLRAAERTAHV